MKGGVIAFTKSLARENARHNINVNAVAPGPTETPLLKEEMEENPDLIQRMTRIIPFRRVGQPEDQAAAVSFLVSSDFRLHHRSNPKRERRPHHGLSRETTDTWVRAVALQFDLYIMLATRHIIGTRRKAALPCLQDSPSGSCLMGFRRSASPRGLLTIMPPLFKHVRIDLRSAHVPYDRAAPGRCVCPCRARADSWQTNAATYGRLRAGGSQPFEWPA